MKRIIVWLHSYVDVWQCVVPVMYCMVLLGGCGWVSERGTVLFEGGLGLHETSTTVVYTCLVTNLI